MYCKRTHGMEEDKKKNEKKKKKKKKKRRKKKNKAVYTSRSRVRVGRGSDEIDQLNGWAGAVTPKPPVNAEKS